MYQLPIVTNDLSKTQIKIMAEHIVAELQDNGRIIESADALAKMELLIKEIKSSKDWIDCIRTEIAKFGKDFKTSSGTKIELAEVGVKYDYTSCNDIVLNELQKESDLLSEKIKERQTFLKSVSQSGMEYLEPLTGELVKIYPPTKTSTSSVKTTIAK